jgi:hypothetical protein
VTEDLDFLLTLLVQSSLSSIRLRLPLCVCTDGRVLSRAAADLIESCIPCEQVQHARPYDLIESYGEVFVPFLSMALEVGNLQRATIAQASTHGTQGRHLSFRSCFATTPDPLRALGPHPDASFVNP